MSTSSEDAEEENKELRMLFGLLVIIGYLVLTAVWRLFPGLKADIYDFLIIRMTTKWYAAVLERCAGGDRIIDVGIGTATALVNNKEILQRKNLVVVGIDPEAEYIKKAGEVISAAGISERCKVNCASIYDPKLRMLFTGAARFDAAYFSGSLTLMPDPAAALKCAASMLTDKGVIYITQTFQNRPSPIMERLKPLLRRFTSVDFGKVFYHAEVQSIVAKAGMQVVEDNPVSGSIDNAAQTARLIVLKPTAATKKD